MSKKTPALPLTPEWSHKIDVTKLGNEKLRVTLVSTADQRKDLARRFKVNAIENLGGEVILERQPGTHMIRVTGKAAADIVQSCIITLAPVPDHLDEEIDSWFSDEEQVVSLSRARREQQGMRADAELEVLPEEQDPEAVIGGMIDAGELAAQYLSLAINPYPRSPEAIPEPDSEPIVQTIGERVNPFAALKEWKKKKDGE